MLFLLDRLELFIANGKHVSITYAVFADNHNGCAVRLNNVKVAVIFLSK